MKKLILPIALLVFSLGTLRMNAQEKLSVDTLHCSNIGFTVSPVFPSTNSSFAKTLDGTRTHDGTMASLYKGPYLSFGLEYSFKSRNGWLFSGEGELTFGNDNLTLRNDRMGDVFTRDSIVVGTNGVDANVTCYNRGLSLRAGVGKIFQIMPKNPNSGPFVRASAGLMQQQTVFFLNDVNAPQVDGDYANLYDHQRRGFNLSQEVGFWYMNNTSNVLNFHVSFEVTECWTHSTRKYVIDDVLGLRGPDNNKYFDLLYSIKFCWMFPLTGKTAYDYYYH